MRFSAVAALCAAPLALASSLQADLVARGALNAEKRNTVIVQESGNSGSSTTEVIIVWVNNGGAGQATQTINSALSAIASSTIAAAATHTVTVGGTAGLVYTPSSINASVGDMVEFQFQSQNHTVTQSAFAEPCVKLTGGMDSGFMANINNSLIQNPPKFAMQVTVATPLWFYCRQTGHCGKGMTLSINANPPDGSGGNKTAAAFQQLAIKQNGTGSTAVIAGGTGASSSAAPVSLASATASAAGTASTAGSGLTSGSGTLNSNGACDCSCLCGTAAFPNAAVQGIGAFGGMSGAMPMSALEVSVTTS